MTCDTLHKIIKDASAEDDTLTANTVYIIVNDRVYLLDNWGDFLERHEDADGFVFFESKGNYYYFDIESIQGFRIVKEPDLKR